MFNFGKKIDPVVVESVDSIVSDLQSKVEALHAISLDKDVQAANIENEISHLKQVQKDVKNEADRASNIAQKIASLLS